MTQTFILFEVATILATYSPSPVAERVLPMLAWRPATSALGVRMTSTFLAGAFLCALGGIMRILCYRALGRHFTFELSDKPIFWNVSAITFPSVGKESDKPEMWLRVRRYEHREPVSP